MSPVGYTNRMLSSAKMKVIRPEMELRLARNIPGKENAMKRQQEAMASTAKSWSEYDVWLYPCIDANARIFFALFRFFPTNIELRQKGFLWADDLSCV